MPPHVAVDTVPYKIFISGKTGVGKTALAARLAGMQIPSTHYETTGRFKRVPKTFWLGAPLQNIF